MNNRKRNRAAARRKVVLSKRQALHRLLDVVLDINGLEARTQEKTGCLPTAFFEFHGQCAITNVWAYCNGWSPDSTADYAKFTNDKRELENAAKELEALINGYR